MNALRRKRGSRRKAGGSHGEMSAIIPMIDMLVTLVLYMLVHQADYQIVNAETVKIPQSTADVSPREATSMMITKDMVFVNNRPVVTIANVEAETKAVVPDLYTVLRTETHKRTVKAVKDSDREVTVVADKSIPYRLIKKVMTTAMAADVGKLSLVVIEKGGSGHGSAAK